jgi:NADPH-dependent 2,4-dienoyl-CoA reductase/sulfur reductase-like enzyme/Pyruvate/2-oxoacid:ferredoxin oxidoreductase delta subunit/bacterioferritin-associated ferredoxin
MKRIEKHPILAAPAAREMKFTFNGKVLKAHEGEMISAALYASGITVFGHHHRDNAPMGIYCANGQCSQCMVIADGRAVKACMTRIGPGMVVRSCNAKPSLPKLDTVPVMGPVETIETQCLVIGGGPAGLSAAIELARFGVRTIVVDDKLMPGGKLTLQTHNFFGSRGDCFAGTRGMDIAVLLEKELEKHAGSLVEVWLNSPAVGVFSDKTVGVVRDGVYTLVRPEVLLVAAGAREKTLAFPGCDLPGVYGAGAFQTLVNRDMVRAAERLFICGGGNVGLIAGYHALQAGIEVVGLVEALPECGGYKVHLDKLKRLGVPVYTSHTIRRARGAEILESVTVCEVDRMFAPVPGTEKTFAVDTLLIAVGLSPVNELFLKAREYGMAAFAAGDAEEIAEASAAMFSGRIQGRKIARLFGRPVPAQKKWDELVGTLRSRPGGRRPPADSVLPGRVYPVFHCVEEIPCNPCADSCPKGSIKMEQGVMTGVPRFDGDACLGCAECVIACPGLAITLVDEGYDPGKKSALVTLPFELSKAHIRAGDRVVTVTMEGETAGAGKVIAFRDSPRQDQRSLVLLEVPFEQRLDVAGIRLPWPEESPTVDATVHEDDTIICRCERITKQQIVDLIRAGYRDLNMIKASLRTGMGACTGKNCAELILRLFREEGVGAGEVTPHVYRPPDIEIPLGVFAGVRERQTGQDNE